MANYQTHSLLVNRLLLIILLARSPDRGELLTSKADIAIGKERADTRPLADGFG